MKCERCEVDFENLRVGECPLCEAVSKIMVVIFSKWEPSEYKELAQNLRNGTIKELLKRYEDGGAFLSLRVCRLIRHLAHSLDQTEDYLKGRVCEALLAQHGHEEGCAKWMRENGKTRELAMKQLWSSLHQAIQGQMTKIPDFIK